jgi:hypothetical protein
MYPVIELTPDLYTSVNYGEFLEDLHYYGKLSTEELVTICKDSPKLIQAVLYSSLEQFNPVWPLALEQYLTSHQMDEFVKSLRRLDDDEFIRCLSTMSEVCSPRMQTAIHYGIQGFTLQQIGENPDLLELASGYLTSMKEVYEKQNS